MNNVITMLYRKERIMWNDLRKSIQQKIEICIVDESFYIEGIQLFPIQILYFNIIKRRKSIIYNRLLQLTNVVKVVQHNNIQAYMYLILPTGGYSTSDC